MPVPPFERGEAKRPLQDRDRDLAVHRPPRRVGNENVPVPDAAFDKGLAGEIYGI
jgi:hypothetical protein